MSKPMALENPAASAAREKPTTPPAGQERRESLPVKVWLDTKPPAEVMRRSGEADCGVRIAECGVEAGNCGLQIANCKLAALSLSLVVRRSMYVLRMGFR